MQRREARPKLRRRERQETNAPARRAFSPSESANGFQGVSHERPAYRATSGTVPSQSASAPRFSRQPSFAVQDSRSAFPQRFSHDDMTGCAPASLGSFGPEDRRTFEESRGQMAPDAASSCYQMDGPAGSHGYPQGFLPDDYAYQAYPPFESPRKKRSRMPRLLAIVLATMVGGALLGFLIFNISRCTAGEVVDPFGAIKGKEVFVDPHDWSGLQEQEGKLFYYEGDTLKSKLGIDVSQYQGAIDWNAAAADDIEFAIIRMGYRTYNSGTLFEDSAFQTNLAGARAAGLQVGVYFYSQAISADEAKEEAQFVLAGLQGAPLDLPVVFDHEPSLEGDSRANYIDSDTLDECAAAFDAEVKAAGYSTMLYGNAYDFARYGEKTLEKYPLWFADYNSVAPANSYPISLWQYTSNGVVDGIDARLDMNLLLL